jgi:hypothetical protein
MNIILWSVVAKYKFQTQSINPVICCFNYWDEDIHPYTKPGNTIHVHDLVFVNFI